MDEELTLRLASFEDTADLLAWRNDRETRMASLSTQKIALEDHVRWLQASINNPHRKLYIAVLAGHSVGTIRADIEQNAWCLSWTVAPQYRGEGIAQKMLAAFFLRHQGVFVAQIKATNKASQIIAERAGFKRMTASENGEVLNYRR